MIFSKELEAEIAYRLGVWNEDQESHEPGEVLTREQVIKELMEDMDDHGHYASEFRNELRKHGITCGVWKAHTKEQLSRIWTSGGRKYDFKLNGMFYVFDSWDGLTA